MTHGGDGDEGGTGGGDERDEGTSSPGARARKERVLHTRVPAVLEDELKRLATNLRMPVSNVVRAILEDAIEAVELVGERAEGTLEGIVDRIAAQRLSLKQAVRGEPAAGPATPAAAAPTAPAPTPAAPSLATPAPAPASTAAPEAASAATTCPDPDGEPARRALDGVIGFQRLALATEAACTVCGKKLPRGSEACRGVREESGPRVLLGPRCTLVPGSSE